MQAGTRNPRKIGGSFRNRTTAGGQATRQGQHQRSTASLTSVASDAGDQERISWWTRTMTTTPARPAVAKLDPPEIKPQTRACDHADPAHGCAKSPQPEQAQTASRDFSRCPRSFAHRQRRPLADPRPGTEDRQNRDRSRPRRTRYRHDRTQRSGGKRPGARCGPAPGQAAAGAAGRRRGLHAQGRHVYSAGNPHLDRQPGAGRPVRFDPRQLQPRSGCARASRPTT